MTSLQYPALIPRVSHSGNALTAEGMKYRPRDSALDCVFLQPNTPTVRQWLTFDVDDRHAWYLPEERGLPTPTYIAINRANGHAHVAYLLAAPISLTESSRQKPIRFLCDIERAFTRRLGADAGYSGHTTRNPLHPRHLTDWQSGIPWRLDELNDALDRSDKVFLKSDTMTTGTGRNVVIFDLVRNHAYKQVLKFKKAGKSEQEFRDYLMTVCHEVNRVNFPANGLWIAELYGIARSVARWTWRQFTLEKFSALKSVCGRRAWSKKHGTITSLEPWTAQGVSRATYYRRIKSGGIILI